MWGAYGCQKGGSPRAPVRTESPEKTLGFWVPGSVGVLGPLLSSLSPLWSAPLSHPPQGLLLLLRPGGCCGQLRTDSP